MSRRKVSSSKIFFLTVFTLQIFDLSSFWELSKCLLLLFYDHDYVRLTCYMAIDQRESKSNSKYWEIHSLCFIGLIVAQCCVTAEDYNVLDSVPIVIILDHTSWHPFPFSWKHLLTYYLFCNIDKLQFKFLIKSASRRLL